MLQVKLIPILSSLTAKLAYFFTGLSSGFLFWLGLLFEYQLYSTKVALVSASLILVAVAWVAHRRSRSKPSMKYTTVAFVGGGIISAVGVWLLFLLWVFWVSIVAYGNH